MFYGGKKLLLVLRSGSLYDVKIYNFNFLYFIDIMSIFCLYNSLGGSGLSIFWVVTCTCFGGACLIIDITGYNV